MSKSTDFANHFARLTSLLVRQSGEQEDQSRELMSAVACASGLPVLLIRDGDTLLADGVAPAPSTIYTMVLIDRLRQHGVVRLEVTPPGSAADVMGLARLLALAPGANGASNIQQGLAAIRAASLRVEFEAPRAAPAKAPAAPPPPASPIAEPVSFDEFEVVSEAQMRSAIVAQPATPTPSYGMSAAGAASVDQLLQSLETTTETRPLETLLGTLEPHVGSALQGGNMDQAVAIVIALVRQENRVTDPEARKVLGRVINRVVSPSLVAAISSRLPGAADRLPNYVTILARGGDTVIEALAERLAESEVAKERRAIFSALVQLKSGVPMFIRMLGDHRWFVVRNAADLLAQIGAPEAEMPLLRVLDHKDTRVRRSVLTALARLNGQRAQIALRKALEDDEVEIRLAAASGIGRYKSLEAEGAVLDALGKEQDTGVQEALLGALGRLATETSVKKLVEASSAELLFKRKTPTFRLAAVRALREAGTPLALSTLKTLANDKDTAVRDVAAKSTK